MKHTPAPWIVVVDTDEEADWAHKWPQIKEAKEDGYTVVGTEGIYGDFETDMANASLIAAAPELLEALKKAIEYAIWPNDSISHALIEAEAAIKKAEGEA